MNSGSQSLIVFITLLIFIAISVWLGTVAQRLVRRGSFLTSYFLGNRGLGVWTMALTATVQSGGTFMGFPSLVYSYGWVVIVWIAGYMVVPLIGFGLFAKRLAHLSRITGAITVPDLFRQRFNSPGVGLVSSLIVILLMSLMMVAQFKAGAIIMKLCWPFGPGAGEVAAGAVDWPYYTGLVVFAVTVIGYTLIGGFMASVWTDLFQSIMMLVGVILLLLLTLPAVGGLEAATRQAIANTDSSFAFAPGYNAPPKKPLEKEAASDGQPSGDVAGAPASTAARAAAQPPHAFLPLGLAVSFFFIWPFAGAGTPASMVRVMAAQSTQVLRRSMIVLCLYNMLIYIPLVMICIAGRAILPALDKPDEVVPTLALTAGAKIPGGSLLAALIMAAPFGAVMATVSCYLLVISSGLVRDIYLRFIRPQAAYAEVRMVNNVAMVLVGAIAIGANIQPVKYLQAVVVLSGTMAAASFLVPAVMACYWRRATWQGALAAMLGGAGTIIALYGYGWWYRLNGGNQHIGIAGDQFGPYYLLNLDPVLWAVGISALAGVFVSWSTPPMDPRHVVQLFAPEENSGMTQAESGEAGTRKELVGD